MNRLFNNPVDQRYACVISTFDAKKTQGSPFDGDGCTFACKGKDGLGNQISGLSAT